MSDEIEAKLVSLGRLAARETAPRVDASLAVMRRLARSVEPKPTVLAFSWVAACGCVFAALPAYWGYHILTVVSDPLGVLFQAPGNL